MLAVRVPIHRPPGALTALRESCRQTDAGVSSSDNMPGKIMVEKVARVLEAREAFLSLVIIFFFQTSLAKRVS